MTEQINNYTEHTKSEVGTNEPVASEYDLDDIMLHSRIFYKKFIELSNLTHTDKICIWNNTIYKDSSWPSVRWAWRKGIGQNRYRIKNYLEVSFQEYRQLLEMIIVAEQTIRRTMDTQENNNTYVGSSAEKHIKILNIMNYNKNLINKIKSGLLITDYIYYEDSELNLSPLITKTVLDLDRFVSVYNLNLERCENKKKMITEN